MKGTIVHYDHQKGEGKIELEDGRHIQMDIVTERQGCEIPRDGDHVEIKKSHIVQGWAQIVKICVSLDEQFRRREKLQRAGLAKKSDKPIREKSLNFPASNSG